MHVYDCGLTMGKYMRMFVYVCVHIGVETYVRRNHSFIPASTKCSYQLKRDQQLRNVIISHV